MDEIIARKLPKPIPEIHGPLPCHYTPEQVLAVTQWRALPQYKENVLAQDVLDVIGERHKIKLTLRKYGETIAATDGKHTYYLIGSWFGSFFLCRGLVKGRKGAKHTFLINGQANTGTVQVEHYAELMRIDYPEIQAIIKKLPF